MALEQRAVEVWNVLAAVKTEFGKFGEGLDRAKKQLITAQNTLDQADTRTRAMRRKLKDVESLGVGEAAAVLELAEESEESEESGDETI